MRDAGDGRYVVVTGAAGAIGSVIVARLTGRWRLRGTDLRPRAEIDELDVTDPDRCRAMFSSVDAVVHLAGDPDPQADWARLRSANVEGAYVVADAARECGVPRLVLASAGSIGASTSAAEPRRRSAAAGEPLRRD